jgi:RNA polymerase sigma-70 factor, ECF subfamily
MMSSRAPGEFVAYPIVWARSPELSMAVPQTLHEPLQDDEELLSRLRTRELCDLNALFETYSRLVVGLACRVLHDPDEAKEVAQEVFFYLYRRLELFDPSKGTLKAWIVQITLCRALDRKSLLARRRLSSIDIDGLELPERTNLETEVEARLKRTHLERALADLPIMQRKTIEFFYFEGLDLREISQQLCQPIGNVRHHFYRGLERLRKNTVLHRFCCK